MKKYIIGFWYSLPIQLFLLHFKKYQVILFFWYILFATIAGKFMENFGAESLYLAPEYFDDVNFLSSGFVGFAIGVFIMSWHITSFILHRRHIQFLASTAQPFLKFCINNSVIPLLFLVFYFIKAIWYNHVKELMSITEIIWLASGFIVGFTCSILIAFIYFFGADKTIYKSLQGAIQTANKNYESTIEKIQLPPENRKIRVDWFFSARMHLRKPRDTRHYKEEFLDTVFKRHHFAAIIAFLTAFIFLIIIGFTADARLLQIPAAASITIFFALLIAVVGAFSLFLKTWSIPAIIIIYLVLNFLYQHEIIDHRNKAYGLNYWNKAERPAYSQQSILQLANDADIEKDKQLFIQRLNAWKAKQNSAKPVMYIINTSGGGLRSANFTFHVLQNLDSLLKGSLMQKTILINGASGGMLGAAYYRELYLQQKGSKQYISNSSAVNNISKDLLNPLFSSFVSKDIIGPVQKFKFKQFEYVKDRGYAFEQKLNNNTNGLLNKSLKDYLVDENNATIPTMLFNSVVSRDGRKMIMCTQPVRFLMKPVKDSTNKIVISDPDAIDFNSFFAKQNSTDVGVLSALRMNATFPFVLPNVWLPTQPVIDVMDAGLRDNFGQENTLRFIEVFEDWIKNNVSKVVIIQIRDRSISDWDKPYDNNTLLGAFTKPAFLLQYNWFKMQDYYQHSQLEYLSENFSTPLERICFQYVASDKNKTASLSFHLTASEKKEIATSLYNQINTTEFNRIKKIIADN